MKNMKIYHLFIIANKNKLYSFCCRFKKCYMMPQKQRTTMTNQLRSGISFWSSQWIYPSVPVRIHPYIHTYIHLTADFYLFSIDMIRKKYSLSFFMEFFRASIFMNKSRVFLHIQLKSKKKKRKTEIKST